MKKIITVLLVLTASFVNAQAFKGKGDTKFQVGLNMQNWGTGIMVSTDFGLGENMSFGFVSSYLLNTKSYTMSETEYFLNNPNYDPIIDGNYIPKKEDAKFMDRFDVKARFNANIGNVLNFSENLDVYPGLNLGLRNFGAHLGARYFFTDGFGLFSEMNFPLAKYGSSSDTFDKLNNQFVLNIGASFNL